MTPLFLFEAYCSSTARSEASYQTLSYLSSTYNINNIQEIMVWKYLTKENLIIAGKMGP